jgi:two-component system, LuxR family, sensor kinase FixL
VLRAPVAGLDYVNLFGRDITEMRRAEQQARHHQAELVHVCRLSTMGEMSTGMAHELNQPLSAIVNFARGGVRRLNAGIGNKKDLAQAFEQIALQAERAGEIIRRLRNLVARQPPVRAVVDLNALVREVVTFVEYEARKLGVDIDSQLNRSTLRIRVDLVQIEQVLLNLLRNAMDALQEIPPGRRSLQIRTSRMRDGRVRVQIRDSGPGIPPDVMDRLFTPFFTTKGAGMGMGLPISKTIVDDHRGTITARSRIGYGATFAVLLPAHVESPNPGMIAGASA